MTARLGLIHFTLLYVGCFGISVSLGILEDMTNHYEGYMSELERISYLHQINQLKSENDSLKEELMSLRKLLVKRKKS